MEVVQITEKERNQRSLPELENEIIEKQNKIKNLYGEGMYALALQEAETVLPIILEAYGEDHPVTASGYNNLGLIYKSLYDYEKAENNYKKSLSIYEATCGPNNPSTLTSMTNLALLYKLKAIKEKSINRISFLSMAETLATDSYEARLESLGESDPSLTVSRRLLASIYRLLDQPQKCEELLKKAEEISEDIHGVQHVDTATVYNDLGFYYKSVHKYELSESYYKKAIEIRLLFLGEKNPETIATRYNLAELYKECGRTEESGKIMEMLVDLIRSNYMTQKEAEEFIQKVVEHSNELS